MPYALMLRTSCSVHDEQDTNTTTTTTITNKNHSSVPEESDVRNVAEASHMDHPGLESVWASVLATHSVVCDIYFETEPRTVQPQTVVLPSAKDISAPRDRRQALQLDRDVRVFAQQALHPCGWSDNLLVMPQPTPPSSSHGRRPFQHRRRRRRRHLSLTSCHISIDPSTLLELAAVEATPRLEFNNLSSWSSVQLPVTTVPNHASWQDDHTDHDPSSYHTAPPHTLLFQLDLTAAHRWVTNIWTNRVRDGSATADHRNNSSEHSMLQDPSHNGTLNVAKTIEAKQNFRPVQNATDGRAVPCAVPQYPKPSRTNLPPSVASSETCPALSSATTVTTAAEITRVRRLMDIQVQRAHHNELYRDTLEAMLQQEMTDTKLLLSLIAVVALVLLVCLVWTIRQFCRERAHSLQQQRKRMDSKSSSHHHHHHQKQEEEASMIQKIVTTKTEADQPHRFLPRPSSNGTVSPLSLDVGLTQHGVGTTESGTTTDATTPHRHPHHCPTHTTSIGSLSPVSKLQQHWWNTRDVRRRHRRQPISPKSPNRVSASSTPRRRVSDRSENDSDNDDDDDDDKDTSSSLDETSIFGPVPMPNVPPSPTNRSDAGARTAAVPILKTPAAASSSVVLDPRRSASHRPSSWLVPLPATVPHDDNNHNRNAPTAALRRGESLIGSTSRDNEATCLHRSHDNSSFLDDYW